MHGTVVQQLDGAFNARWFLVIHGKLTNSEIVGLIPTTLSRFLDEYIADRRQMLNIAHRFISQMQQWMVAGGDFPYIIQHAEQELLKKACDLLRYHQIKSVHEFMVEAAGGDLQPEVAAVAAQGQAIGAVGAGGSSGAAEAAANPDGACEGGAPSGGTGAAAPTASDLSDAPALESKHDSKAIPSLTNLAPLTLDQDQTSQLESMLQDAIDTLPENSDLRASLEEYVADLQALHTQTPLKQPAVEFAKPLTEAELSSVHEASVCKLHDSIVPAEEPLKASEFDLSGFVMGMDIVSSGGDLLAGLGGISVIGSGTNATYADGLTA